MLKSMFVLGALAVSTSLVAAPVTPIAGNAYKFNAATNKVEVSSFTTASLPNSVFVIEGTTLYDCPNCVANRPRFDAMATAWKAETRVKFFELAVTSNTRNITRWVTQYKPEHPMLQDTPSYEYYKKMRVTDGVPQTWVVDCDGEVQPFVAVGQWLGGERQQLDAAVRDALKTCEPVEAAAQ